MGMAGWQEVYNIFFNAACDVSSSQSAVATTADWGCSSFALQPGPATPIHQPGLATPESHPSKICLVISCSIFSNADVVLGPLSESPGNWDIIHGTVIGSEARGAAATPEWPRQLIKRGPTDFWNATVSPRGPHHQIDPLKARSPVPLATQPRGGSLASLSLALRRFHAGPCHRCQGIIVRAHSAGVSSIYAIFIIFLCFLCLHSEISRSLGERGGRAGRERETKAKRAGVGEARPRGSKWTSGAITECEEEPLIA